MKKSKKFTPEFRERAVRMVQEQRGEHPSLWAAVVSIAPKLECVPQTLLDWKEQVARDRPVILYCAKGHEISQGIAATLQVMGLDARYLIDGFAGWRDAGQATRELTL